MKTDKSRFRSVVFWLHLAAGLVAGAVIAIMSFTGAVLAFETEIVAWAERDVRRVAPPAADARPLPLDRLVADFQAKYPDARIAGITVSADPRDAFAVSAGRDGTYYLNPYTGAIREPGPTRTHDFLHAVEDWHRYLGRSGDRRPYGKAVTGAANLAFLFLGVSGLYLWWPRAWNARILRPSLWFVRGAGGKARDWNWHNVVGFWSLPALIVITASGAVIGYKWAGDLVYRLAGETPPGQPPAPSYNLERPDGALKLGYGGALTRFQTAFPHWETITLREGLPPRRGAPQAVPSAGPRPYSASIREAGRWQVAATTQAVLHPFTGEFLQREGYADQTPGRQARLWLRFLHTGQALGWPGQLVAAVASLGGVLLVYTGFALGWRRFFGQRQKPRP